MSYDSEDTIAASKAAHAAFDAKVAEFSQQAAQNTPMAEVDAEAVSLCSAAQALRGGDGGRPYESDPQYRSRVEQARTLAFNGGTKAQVEALLRGGQPQQAAPQQQAPAQANEPDPQGTPIERFAARLEAGEIIERSEVPPAIWTEMCGGYSVELGEGFGLADEHIAALQEFAEAGVSQRQVDVIIEGFKKRQQQ